MGCIPSTPKPTTKPITIPNSNAINPNSTSRTRLTRSPIYDPPEYTDASKLSYNRGSGGVYKGASGSVHKSNRVSDATDVGGDGGGGGHGLDDGHSHGYGGDSGGHGGGYSAAHSSDHSGGHSGGGGGGGS